MTKHEVSWLIIRGLGLYLLLTAFMLVPDLLAGVYASYTYRDLLSSLASQDSGWASTVRQATETYRSLLFLPIIKIILFSAAGAYMLRGGGFLFRLLSRHSIAEE